MKRTNILTSIFAIVILAGIASGTTPGGPGGYTNIYFNKQKFDNSLQTAIAPNVIGYQYVLIKDGQIVSEDAGGVAQNAADGTLMMTTSTPTNIGSVAKFLSGTAMIHLMEKKSGPGTWDDGLTLQQKLDRPFTSIVPDIWATGNRPGVEDTTLRQLLQHRSGFNDNKPSNRNVLGFLKDADGFLPGQYDQRQYSNINFVLNGYLIPFYENTWLKGFMNQSIIQQGLGLENADESTKQLAGSMMHNTMKARIWDKMTPKILPNCDAANALPNSAAYGYNSKNDLAAGQISSAIDSQGHCGGHGGYFMSARALANYLAHFSSTNVVVTSQGRNAMWNDAMDPDDRLVWTSASASNWFDTNFNTPYLLTSNGIAGDYRTVITRFPQNYYLVVLTNSPDLSASDLFTVGKDAFIEGMEDNF